MKSNNTHRFLLVVTLLVAVTCLNHAATKYGHGLLGYGQKHSYYTVKPEKQDTGMAKKQHSEESKKAKKQRNSKKENKRVCNKRTKEYNI